MSPKKATVKKASVKKDGLAQTEKNEQGNPDLTFMLEFNLERARDGRLLGLAIISLTESGCGVYSQFPPYQEDSFYNILGALESLKLKIWKNCERNCYGN